MSDVFWIRFGFLFIFSFSICRSALFVFGKGVGRIVWFNVYLLDKRVRFVRFGGCWLEVNDLGSSGLIRVESLRY